MTPIDLRSDTVTRPTPEMRRAMAEAEVGDDVYGEDPTVNRLEEKAAEMLGMEAALFVPSGTMGNAIAVRLLTERGDEVLVERRSHVVRYELAGMSVDLRRDAAHGRRGGRPPRAGARARRRSRRTPTTSPT